MKEAGIDFDEHRIVLDTPTTKKEISAFSEAGKVPILQLGDVTVWDSLAIAETVAERWPEKQLWPADPDERAHMRAQFQPKCTPVSPTCAMHAHELPGDGAQSFHSG